MIQAERPKENRVVGAYCEVDIKSRWRHKWKSAQVVNSHLVCDPTIWPPGFDLFLQQWSLLNRLHMEQGHCRACRRKWRLTCVLVARPKQCPTLSNPVPWQYWMAAYFGCSLRMKTLFHGWPIMVNDTHTRRRRRSRIRCQTSGWVTASVRVRVMVTMPLFALVPMKLCVSHTLHMWLI